MLFFYICALRRSLAPLPCAAPLRRSLAPLPCAAPLRRYTMTLDSIRLYKIDFISPTLYVVIS
jgi:hypothetical protein